MLLVKTKIGPSKIEGIGLFANQFIPRGTIVQKFMPGFDLIFEEKHLKKFPGLNRRWLLKYAYLSKSVGKYILCIDDARFMNHSERPNLTSFNSPEEIDVANRDIGKGEELTCNYKDFDDNYDFNMKKILL